MKKIITICLSIATISIGYSQANAVGAASNFTLKQCIDYALTNQYSMKNATLDQAISSARVKQVTGMGLPQISGNLQFSDNDPLRRMFIDPTNPFFAAFIPPSAASAKVVAIPNIFQLPAGGDAGLTINQLLFSNSYFVGLQAAKTYKELSAKAAEQTKIQITEAVTKAYYMVLINQERIKLLDKNVSRLDSLLAQTKLMNQNGFVEDIDVSRLQVTYNNIITQRNNFNNLMSLSIVLLKYQMSMPLGNELTTAEKINDFKVEGVVENTSQKTNYDNRIEYSLLQSQRKLQTLDLKNNQWAFLPTLSAFANVGEFSQSTKFDYFSGSNAWYGYGLFGINLGVPIFSGMQNSYKVQQSKLTLKKSENDIANLEEAIDVQIKSSVTMLNNNIATLESQSKNMELAAAVENGSKIKYKEGVGSNLEVVTAETALLEAQTNYFSALYDALVSKIDYLKATGTLK